MLLRSRLSVGTVAQQQLVTELLFSNLVSVRRSLYGSTVERAEGVEMQLSYPKPAHFAIYKRVFKVPVTFDCEHSQLFLPAS